MSNISTELLAEKLSDWTLSSKVQDALGLSSMDEDSFKKEFSALETKGLVIRDGVRRGLKFKVSDTIKAGKIGASESSETPAETTSVPVVKTKPKTEKKKSSHSSLNVKDIPAEVTIFPNHEYIHEVTHVSVTKLLSFILDAGTEQRTMSIQRTSKGITVKTYRNGFCLSEVIYTKENFKTLLSASNINLD